MSLVRYGSWRWMVATVLASLLSIATFLALRSAQNLAPTLPASPPATAPAPKVSGALSNLAATDPGRRVEVIVQLAPGADMTSGRALIRSAGGTITDRVPIIEGFGARMTAGAAKHLAANPSVHAVSLNAPVKSQDNGHLDTRHLGTAYDLSIRADTAWGEGDTGRGMGVAVVDTGVQGDMNDFQVSRSNTASRVIASAVVNPGAGSAGDSFGHGTHVAGIIGGDGTNRASNDPLDGRYVGVAPDANLIDVKIADEQGDASVLDVIDGLQFAVDNKAAYIDSMKSGKSRYRTMKRNDESVRTFGCLAILSGTAEYGVGNPGQERTVPLRFTSIWAKRPDGTVQFVSWQATAIPVKQ